MTEEKMKKIVPAVVSAATVLLVFLLGFLIYQWISIGTKNNKIEKLEAEMAEIQAQIDQMEGDVDYYQSTEGLRYQYSVLEQKLEMIKGK